MTLYTDLIDAGIEVRSWQSDLCFPVTITFARFMDKRGFHGYTGRIIMGLLDQGNAVGI